MEIRTNLNFIIQSGLDRETVDNLVFYVLKNHSLIRVIDCQSTPIDNANLDQYNENKINFFIYNVHPDDIVAIRQKDFGHCIVVNSPESLLNELNQEEWQYYFEDSRVCSWS